MDDMYAGSALHKKRREEQSDKDDDDYWKKVSSGGGGYGHFEEGEETNEVVGVAAGIAGIIAAAGGLTALEMAADDPEFKAKYPKVARALEKMQDIGKAAADAKRMEEEAIAEELEETKEPTTKLGDVWLLGNHRLMCGDSTSIDAVNNLTVEDF